ncbi:MAG: site-specific integrase [Oscillospiraceae bacterium]|nr:site-specific integrase [Oscillospiraceae bacterium]
MANAKQMPSGNWRVQVFLGTNADGKKMKKSITAPTRWQAEMLAAEFLETVQTARSKFTVAQAVRGYIDSKKNVLSPSTVYCYEIILKNRLQMLMPLDIHEVDSFVMQRAINEEAATKTRKTIAEAKNLIGAALKMYGVNPQWNVTLPPKIPKVNELPPAEQVIRMIRGTEIELPCLLAMWLSLRMSEVRGLQFGDIKDGVLTIQRSKLYLGTQDVIRDLNKTYNSTRRLVVPAYIQSLIDRIPHQSETEFIVPLGYKYIKNHLTKLAKANGYKLTFHQLRHLNASIMLMLGIPDKYAMERGGWSSNGVLKSVYQHTFSAERKLVDERIDGFFNDLLRV